MIQPVTLFPYTLDVCDHPGAHSLDVLAIHRLQRLPLFLVRSSNYVDVHNQSAAVSLVYWISRSTLHKAKSWTSMIVQAGSQPATDRDILIPLGWSIT